MNIHLLQGLTKKLNTDGIELTQTSVKSYPRLPRILLDHRDVGVASVLNHRVSCREYSGAPLSLRDLGTILWWSRGIRDGRVSYGSAGSLYPTEIYVLCNNVAELNGRKAYHYNSLDHVLVEIPESEFSVRGLFVNHPWVDSAQAILVVTMVVNRTQKKYGVRGYRYALLEAGALAQTIELVCASTGLGSCLLGCTSDEEVDRTLGLDGTYESVAIAIAIGHNKLDWKRLARPNEDQYDSTLAVRFASAEGYTRPTITDPTFLDGCVQVRTSELKGYHQVPPPYPILQEVETMLSVWPAVREQVKLLLDTVFVCKTETSGAERANSTSGGFGQIYIATEHPLMFTECILHEMAHLKLKAFGCAFEQSERIVFNSPDELYDSPIRKDKKRPMQAVLQALYASLYMCELDLRLLRNGGFNMSVDSVRKNVGRVKAGLSVVRPNIQTDEFGKEFMEGIYEWGEELLEMSAELSHVTG